MAEILAGDERLWERGFEGHARAQRRRLAALTLAEKLAWLEQAHALARRLAGHRTGGDSGAVERVGHMIEAEYCDKLACEERRKQALPRPGDGPS